MSQTQKKERFSRRHRRRVECRWWRPMIETLERRDCPAVQAFFAGGVLTVVGDEGSNVINLFQPRDRVVEIMGDGQTWVFEDVDEVLVEAGDGDDQATSSKPKEIVVVGSKVKMEMGAGNDTVRIDDGGLMEGEPNHISTMNYSLNLGTGADALNLVAGNANILNLVVRSEDGSDSVRIGHTIGLRHEHTRPEATAQIDLDLAGDGNSVDVRLENIENVDLSLASQPVPEEPVVGGTINVYWHVIRSDSTSPFIGRNDGFIQMTSTSSSGSASGGSPTSLSFTATAGDARPLSAANVKLALGSDDDTVSILSDNVDLQLAVDLGAGDDSFAGVYRNVNGISTSLDVRGGVGSDAIGHAAEYIDNISPIDFAGAFQATAVAEVVDLKLRNAPVAGDLSVHAAVGGESDASRASLHLAPGEDVLLDDVLIVDVVGFEKVDLHLATAPNSDRLEKIDLATVSFDDPASTSVHLACRVDGVTLNVDNVNTSLLGWATFPSTFPSQDPVHLDNIVEVFERGTLSAITNHAAPITSVLLADSDGGLQVKAANFSETRLALEAGHSSPIVPDDPGNLQLVSVLLNPAAGSRGPGEFVIPSLVKLDVHPRLLEATLLTETSGSGSVEVAGQFPAGGSEERPTFVSKLRVEDADPLAASVAKTFICPSDPSLPALDVDASLAAATRYELENEAENIPAVRFAASDPGQHDGVVLLNSSLPGGSSAGSNPVSSVRVTFSETLDAGDALLVDVTTGDQDDVVEASASGFETVALNVNTGGGDDLIGWDFSHGDDDPAAPAIASHQRGVDTWAQIDSGNGNDAITFENSGANSIQLFLTAREGDDSAIIDGTSNPVLVAERPPSRMVIDLGAGNDNLAIDTIDFPELAVDATTGAGDDEVHTQNQFRTTALWGVRMHYSLGDGADRLQSEIEGDGNGDVDLLIDAGLGDDNVAIRKSGDRAFFVDETGVIRVTADLGGGNDRYKFDFSGSDQALLEVLAGAGDDLVAIHAQASDPQLFVRDPQSTGMVIDLGSGANQLSVESIDFAEVTQDIRSGNGNDQIAVSDRVGPFFPFESKRLNQQIRTGGGNDIVLNDSEGSDKVQSVIDLGSGNDVVLAQYSWAYLVRRPRTQLNLELSLGAGSDVAMLEASGYLALVCVFDTGPSGDGRDLIEGNFSLSPLDRLRRIRRVLDGRQDLVELFVSADYNVQLAGDETTLYVLIGTPPVS